MKHQQDNDFLHRVKAAARGHWLNIHRRLGIPEHLLNTRKHCPCPHCGGHDRYRYTDHEQNGGYICTQCRGGSGFDLLMLIHRYDFKDALQDVAGVLGMSRETPDMPPKRHFKPLLAPPKPRPKETDQYPQLAAIWQQALPMTDPKAVAIYRYLQGRGLSLNQPIEALRFLPEYPYWHDGEKLGLFPTMLARITNVAGEMQGLHFTYLQAYQGGYTKALISDHEGKRLASKKMRSRLQGATKGASVALYPAAEVLGVAEGIETALAAHELFGIAFHACLSAQGMRSFIIPSSVKSLVIVADNDANQTGIKAMRCLQYRALKARLDVRTWLPQVMDSDALDHLNSQKGLSA